MTQRTLLVSLLGLAIASPLSAQTTGRLSRVIPGLYGPQGLTVDSEAPLPSGETHSGHFNSAFQSSFTQFNIALASQVASVPIPSPAAGFTYTYDAKTGAFVRSTDSFGPIFAERAETIGRHKFSFGFAYQLITFDRIEGIDLDQIPAVFTHDSPAPGGRADVVTTLNRIDATVNQFTTYFTFGLSDRIDLSFAIPINNADLEVTSEATIRRIGTTNVKVHFFGDDGQPGDHRTFHSQASASGIGDVHMQTKMRLFKAEGAAVAGGVDLRFPSGDEDDLLGTGAFGFRPFVAVSASHKVLSMHLNSAYELNGDSVLAGDLDTREKGDLPDRFLWAGGLDFAAHRRVTLVVDLLGQIVIDSPRLLPATFRALDGSTTFDDIDFDRHTVSQTNIATGLKVNVVDRLLVDLNAMVALDDGGLRDRFTPLFGIEYSF